MSQTFLETKQEIWKRKESNSILIAAHRGTYGGGIIPNTIHAYENALRHGADILEIDAARTRDGIFYSFHDGKEPAQLGTVRNIRTMDSSEVDQMHLRNTSFEDIAEKISKLDDVLEYLKGRCLINIDRSWFYWSDIIHLIKRHNMFDQIILKSPLRSEYLDPLESDGSPIMYMPIMYKQEEFELLQQSRVNTIAAELIFTSKDSPLISSDNIEKYHKSGLLLWANTVTLDDRTNLCAFCDDNHSILYGPDDYWGWLIRHGFDILQTDWPLLMKTYVQGLKQK